MQGLVSLLPEPYYTRVKTIWQELHDRFGLKAVQDVPYPHFSWQIGADYPIEKLKKTAETITSRTPPLPIRTSGLGLFTGDQPVIYIAMVKTAKLLGVHKRIWNRFQQVGEDISPLYSPGAWMPHITLAVDDIAPENIGPAMTWLAFQNFKWEMTIDNLSFLCDKQDDTVPQCSYTFRGKERNHRKKNKTRNKKA